MSSHAIESFWQAFQDALPAGSPLGGRGYVAERFGDHPALADELGALILAGVKTATCSCLWEWQAESSALPEAGLITVVLDGRDQPLCVIETTGVTLQAYDQVGAAFAAAEGEGDRTLEYWRQAHWRYFSRVLPRIDRQPALDMPLVCETFRLLYPLPAPTSYDYARRQGVEVIGWERFAALSAVLAERLAGAEPDLLLGIARAGLFPAAAAACVLRKELFPVRVTRRQDDRLVHPHPVWKVDVPAEVAGRRVAVIDEIADTGETLALVAGRAHQLGAASVVTACLAAHTWAQPAPDIVALQTDALVIFPWDRQVYQDGQWQAHPELVEALRLQGLEPLSGSLDDYP